MRMNYVAIVHKDEASDYGVSFPDLPGCVSAGANVAEALSEARVALRLHLDGLADDGDPVLPPPRSIDDWLADARFPDWARGHVLITTVAPSVFRGRTERVNITMDSGVLARVDEVARMRGVSRSRFLSEAALREAEANLGTDRQA